MDNVTISGDQAEVVGQIDVGGLVGEAQDSVIRNSSSAAAVTGAPSSFYAGGLVGRSENTLIEDSVASGAVSGGSRVGGLVGLNSNDSKIKNAQASGNVTIPDSADPVTAGFAGGLVGENVGTIENALATGDVTGLVGDDFENTDYLGVGSFAGDNTGSLRDIQASGAVTVNNATGSETVVADGLLGRNTGSLYNGLAVNDETAHWLRHDNDITLADQPTDPALVDSTAIRNRLAAGTNVTLTTTGDTQTAGGNIDSQGSVDLGDAGQHGDALGLKPGGALSLNGIKAITLNSAQSLQLGEVTAEQAVDIATTTGDLTLAGDISTADTSDQALVLSAGRGEDAGTASGGDIVYTGGELTTGDDGRALLYTGSLSGSDGIAGLINTGDFRYNSNETTTNFTAALDAQRHLIYREQPQILVSADGDTITYGDALPDDYGLQGSQGFVNGDDESILNGTATWSVESERSSAGFQVAGDHRIDYDNGLSNELGYAIVTDTANTGELTVDPLAITVTEIANGESTYGESLTPGEVALEGVLDDDHLEIVAELTDPALSGSGNVNAGTYDQQTSDANLSGSDGGNYTFAAYTEAGSYQVTPRDITVVGDDQIKAKGQPDPALTFTTHCGEQTAPCGLVDGDQLTGELSRESGEALGRYAIGQGDVTSAQNPNYAIAFTAGELQIATLLQARPAFVARAVTNADAASRQAQQDTSVTPAIAASSPLPGAVSIEAGGINTAIDTDIEDDRTEGSN